MFNLIYMIGIPESQVLDVRHYILLKIIILVFGNYATFKKFMPLLELVDTLTSKIYFFPWRKKGLSGGVSKDSCLCI